MCTHEHTHTDSTKPWSYNQTARHIISLTADFPTQYLSQTFPPHYREHSLPAPGFHRPIHRSLCPYPGTAPWWEVHRLGWELGIWSSCRQWLWMWLLVLLKSPFKELMIKNEILLNWHPHTTTKLPTDSSKHTYNMFHLHRHPLRLCGV